MAFVGQALRVFDQEWRGRAKEGAPWDSWVNEVLASLSAEGGIYLASLALWFEEFPFPCRKDRRVLKRRLESFTTTDHLGAVNELSWYRFMCQAGFRATPISPTTTPRPDFRITAPGDFFVEVSTLNVSEDEKKSELAPGGVGLNHNETIRRLLLKASDDKSAQIQFAASQALPCLLVLFDYTFWSGLPTDFHRSLGTALLGREFTFSRLPLGLSGIVYAERKVLAGHICLSRRRSAIYYNPQAHYALPSGGFSMIRQFRRRIGGTEPRPESDWIKL